MIPTLVSSSGLVPVLAPAESAGLRELAHEHLPIPTDKSANTRLKVASLLGGMVAGADSIDDMAALRHRGTNRVFARAYARPLNVGLVPAGVHLRSRPPARRDRLEVVAEGVLPC